MKVSGPLAVGICMSLALPGLLSAALTAPVNVQGGLVQGSIENGLSVFRGVPFAAPPTGALRWRGPQAPVAWQGVKRADSFAPGCMQAMGGPPPSGMNEDCLYLNVWTPAQSARERLPVLVWIYGGGFNGGATSIPSYSGDKLARRGVVLVSIAYRVGMFGFLAHPELSAESKQGVSGNYGLLDMIAGLEWVRKNIEGFGGDPKRVTIFGESAGGIAVSMLCVSPLAKGLFHGAISQSGGSFGPFSKAPVPGENMKVLIDAEETGKEFAAKAGASNLAELRQLSAEKILDAARAQRGMAWPIVDGHVIPDDQHRLYEARQFHDTPILVGYNSDEGLSFPGGRTPEEHVSNVKRRYGPFAERLLEAYPVEPQRVGKTARDLMRDSAFGWHTWAWARLQAKHGKGKAFYYYFDQHPDYAADSPQAGHGSAHGAEIPHVFEKLEVIRSRPLMPSDTSVSEAMATYWTNFAKRGDPNGTGVPEWPAFRESNAKVMYFGGKAAAHLGSVPSEKSLQVLDEYFTWRRSPQGAVVAAPARKAKR